MKMQIKHRFTEAIIYEGDHRSMRAAVVAAVKSGADLSGAELSLADLSGAYLWDANLSRADLSDANLSFTNLSDANLSFATLSDTDLSNANLSRADLSGANLSDADLSDANLSRANFSDANLSGADLSDAELSGANLSFANLSGANLSDANLADATMPGFADRRPKSLREAAELTKEWLRDGHWLQGKWIDTPTAAYEEDCLACLHGAAVYCGGEFGPALSKAMGENGYTVEWNDKDGRTIDEIVAAFDAVIPKLEAINS